MEEIRNSSSSLPVDGDKYALCKAATKEYQSRVPENGLLYQRLQESIDNQGTRGRGETRALIIDVDALNFNVLGDDSWSDLSVSHIRSFQKDNSTRFLIFRHGPREEMMHASALRVIADVIGVLGVTYDIEPLFFEELLGFRNGIKKVTETHIEFMPLEWFGGINPPVTSTDDFKKTIKSKTLIKVVQPTTQTRSTPVVLIFCGSILSTLEKGWTKLAWTYIKDDPSFIESFKNMQTKAQDTIKENPLQFFEFFWRDYEDVFHKAVAQCSICHQVWWDNRRLSDSKNQKSIKDSTMYQIWSQLRQNIESFSSSRENYELYVAKNPLGQMVAAEPRFQITIRKAQDMEAFIRDSLQLHVGDLSLQESRKSLSQADSVSRVTFLAFVFLPLSFVTSIFGMNISSWASPGVSWATFFITAGIMIALTMLVCAYLWKDIVMRLVPSMLFRAFTLPWKVRMLIRRAKRSIRKIFENREEDDVQI